MLTINKIGNKKEEFCFLMREKIICESINSLRSEGLRFSVDSLAEKLKISKKTIYKYFSNKEELAVAIYQRYYSDIFSGAKLLCTKRSKDSYKELLLLYYDAKVITRKEIFNKYILNDSLYSYTSKQNNNFLEIIFLH